MIGNVLKDAPDEVMAYFGSKLEDPPLRETIRDLIQPTRLQGRMKDAVEEMKGGPACLACKPEDD